MPHAQSFRRLDVWREAMKLVEDVYRSSMAFPDAERFGLTRQLRRAAVSIPSNIAEGARRKRRKAYLYHLEVALGSQAEVDVQIEIARRLNMLGEADAAQLHERVDRIGRMLNALINALQPDEVGRDA